MTIMPEDVQHVAHLAGLALDHDELPALAQQIGEILTYISQLEAVEPGDREVQRPYPGPRQPLRKDEARPSLLAQPLAEMAPAFREGLFLVPRLSGTGPEDPSPEGHDA
jgi:aspartyl-tRNA(Asn)/glutamyl-tRNA(Gln) amidotransferase subunit C